MNRRARVALVLALAAALMLSAACASVPVSSPVKLATPSPGAQQRGGVAVYPAGPVQGATPLQVVDGFLESMASYQPGYQIAREFLTPAAQNSWATAAVQVFEQLPTSGLRTDNGDVELKAVQVAAIGPDGRWQSFLPGRERTITFPMEKVDGQWRISQAPVGVLMSKFDTSREFAAYNLAFFDPGFRWFVSERRFLPVRGSLESMLVARLFDGPSAWLAPVVRSAVPDGENASPTVTVTGDTAKVTIDDVRVTSLGDDQRRLLYAQISETLAQVGISAVAIYVRLVPLTIAGFADEAIPVSTWSGFELTDPNVGGVRMAFVGGKLTTLTAGAPGLGMVEAIHGVSGRSCAISTSIDRLAVVGAKGTSVDVADANEAKSRRVYSGADIAQPSFDQDGDLWMADDTAPGSVVWLYRAKKLIPVHIGVLAKDHIVSLRVSPDRSRVAIVTRAGERATLLIARLDRAGTDSSPSIAAPLTIRVDLDRIDGIGWSDSDTLALLASRGGAPLQPYQVSIDGASVDTVGSSPSARSLAAESNQPLLLGGTDGRIYSYEQGVRWQDVGPGENPCYPG